MLCYRKQKKKNQIKIVYKQAAMVLGCKIHRRVHYRKRHKDLEAALRSNNHYDSMQVKEESSTLFISLWVQGEARRFDTTVKDLLFAPRAVQKGCDSIMVFFVTTWLT